MLSGVYGRGWFREGPGLDEESNFERRFRGVGFLSSVICPLTSDWWAGEDLNLRPHAYQARALTS